MKLLIRYSLILIIGCFSSLLYAHASTQAEKQDYHQAESSNIEISPQGQQAADIKTEILEKKALPIYINAPGEVIANANLSTVVAPRIQAQVIQRLVKVGEHVNKQQALVRLSSVDMAKAQADLLLAKKEWLRVKKLGQQAVSAKRYQTVEVNYQQAYSKLLAYGMTKTQIDAFLKSNDPNKANGEFTLLAPRKGTIFSANFSEGQMLAPGNVLYKIVDESQLWVDAKLPSDETTDIQIGASAIIRSAKHQLKASVLQVHHQLDEVTRTRIVRLSVPNPNDLLHPGEFVSCLIQAGETAPVLAVLNTALMHSSDGEMSLYVEVEPNHFKAQEVNVVKKVGPWRVIEGIQPGTRVVTTGAFFVHSELQKGNFSTHNH